MKILAGIETEYGLWIEGRGAEHQVEDSEALVRSDPNQGRFMWDYRPESPRADLRGFTVDRLAIDPVDAQFDRGRTYGSDRETRADRILPSGARFYNDHGHPEFATPEAWSLSALVAHDQAGEAHVLSAAQAYAAETGREVAIYKNNTDFHGASYGTHECYLVPRSLGFEALFKALAPLLAVRSLVCGAGKVGSESGDWVDFQTSQRADFIVEPANVETLFRRPLFNTRDEPHADPREWLRLHVIAGDANMNPRCTRRKMGLIKIALTLAVRGDAPQWALEDPVRAMKGVSRLPSAPIALKGGNWTDARSILASYLEGVPDLEPELAEIAEEVSHLLHADETELARHVDWASKKRILEQTGLDWKDPAMRAYDLEYHNVDPEAGLFHALVQMGQVVADVPEPPQEATRARARGLATRFSGLTQANWSSLTFGEETFYLDPLRDCSNFTKDLSEEEFKALLAYKENGNDQA